MVRGDAPGRVVKTLLRKRTSLSLFFQWLSLGTSLPDIKPEKTLPQALSETEVKAVLEAVTHTRNGVRDRLMVEVMLRAGLRESELLSITPNSLEDVDGTTFLRIVGKGSKERRVPVVVKALAQSLRKVRQGYRPGGTSLSVVRSPAALPGRRYREEGRTAAASAPAHFEAHRGDDGPTEGCQP